MSLEELVDDSRTDKNTTHSYLPLYQQLLEKKKETATNVLEVGVQRGGSIKLWCDFFSNATVYGLDLMPEAEVAEDLKTNPRIVVRAATDAYDPAVCASLSHLKFDFMLDDGPHTLESMKSFISLYLPLMSDDGILIIEDVQSWDWIEVLKNQVPEHLKPFVAIYDLRLNKDRYDDIVFTIDKSK
jgi:hypothetical protein